MALHEYITFVAGISTHLLYFKHSEHHLYPLRWLQGFFGSFGLSIFLQHRYFDSSLGAAFTTTSLLATYFLTGLFGSVTVYRLFFNPLNSIPGHYFARLSRFDITFRVGGQNSFRKLQQLHKEHGQYVRVGPNDISVTDPEAINIVNGPQSRFIKSAWYSMDHPLYSLQSTRSRKIHDQMRRTWAPAFSDKALRRYEDRIASYNKLLVQQIQSLLGKPLNLSKWSMFYAFDVMGDLGFGSSFDMLNSGEAHWTIGLLQDGISIYGTLIPHWLFRFLMAVPGLGGDFKKFIKYCDDQIDARVKRQGSEDDAQDITHYLVDAYEKNPDKVAGLWTLQNDSKLIIIAGSDTTSSTITHIFYHLAHDKDVLKKLREELDARIEGGEITHLKIQDAPYLNGCINEALRLHPPVPSGWFRKAPSEGIYIGKKFIPGNTVVQIPPYVTAHDETLWPSAEEFIPERWYSRPELVKDKNYFQPFSSGPYGCIGKNLAMMEIRLVVAQLVTLFDVALAPGEDGSRLLHESKDHFTLHLAPLDVVWTARK